MKKTIEYSKKSLNFQEKTLVCQDVAIATQSVETEEEWAALDDRWLKHHNESDFCSCEVPIFAAAQKFVPDRCELCGSMATHVYCSRVPVRYIKCGRCGHTFKVARA